MPTTSPHNLRLRIASVSKSHFLIVLSLVNHHKVLSLDKPFRHSHLGNLNLVPQILETTALETKSVRFND